MDDYPVARVTGSPTFHNGRLYVGVASGEEGAGAAANYECCRFRGSLVALNAANGARIWKTFTITEEARPTKKNKAGTPMWGPSGSPIWTSPAIDVRRNVVYVTTGDNYSDPRPTSTRAHGAGPQYRQVLWSRQMTPSDAWNAGAACRTRRTAEVRRSRFDSRHSGDARRRQALVAGQKSSRSYAVDPDRGGRNPWQERVGGRTGGVQWGSATDH